MTEEENLRMLWNDRILELKAQLTGNLFKDGELMDQIYQLKLKLNPEIKDNPNLDTEDCLYCGS